MESGTVKVLGSFFMGGTVEIREQISGKIDKYEWNLLYLIGIYEWNHST